MDLILNLPPILFVPRPNFNVDIYDKYEKIYHIKYYSYCKKLLLNAINQLENEIAKLKDHIDKNQNYGYNFQMENTTIQSYENQISTYTRALPIFGRIIDNIWWEIRNYPEC